MISKCEVENIMINKLESMIVENIKSNAARGKTITTVVFDIDRWPDYIMNKVIDSLKSEQFIVEFDCDSPTKITLTISLK